MTEGRKVIVVGGHGLSAMAIRALLDLPHVDGARVVLKPLDYMDISRLPLVKRSSGNPCSGLSVDGVPVKRKKGR